MRPTTFCSGAPVTYGPVSDQARKRSGASDATARNNARPAALRPAISYLGDRCPAGREPPEGEMAPGAGRGRRRRADRGGHRPRRPGPGVIVVRPTAGAADLLAHDRRRHAQARCRGCPSDVAQDVHAVGPRKPSDQRGCDHLALEACLRRQPQGAPAAPRLSLLAARRRHAVPEKHGRRPRPDQAAVPGLPSEGRVLAEASLVVFRQPRQGELLLPVTGLPPGDVGRVPGRDCGAARADWLVAALAAALVHPGDLLLPGSDASVHAQRTSLVAVRQCGAADQGTA
jgi:hypothetical protein